MLKLYNKEHEAISALANLKDYKIEYLLSGEDLLEFSLSISDEYIHLVEEEGYVRNKNNEYVIKAIDPSDNFKRFSCVVNIEDIKAKSIKKFDTSNNTISETIRLAIAGTGWILADNNITKRRTVRAQNTNALEVLREVRKVFRVDFRFDTIDKTIHVYEQFGSDKGVYFSDELNLRNLSIPSDTYDYSTRIYPYGKDGLNISSINGEKEYLDNNQYSNKVIELIWEDNRYTDINSLKSDAEAKLEELSKPKRSYHATISDLAKQSEEYSYLDFFVGDTIYLLSKSEKFRDKQRIVKYIEYPNNPYQNTCELGNTQLTFEELQKENEAKNQVVDNITSDNGTLDGSKIDNITTDQISDFESSVGKITDLTVVNAKIENLEATNVTITGKLTAIEGEFGTIKANVANIDKLVVNHTAEIKNLVATTAKITDLNVTNATIDNLEAKIAKIDTLVNGNLSSENIQAGGITSDRLTIANGFITNAMIANLDVSKVNAGDISTNKFKIKSDDGGIEIVGATQQFKDKNNKVRIQMGKDAQGNFNFIIRGEDGTTTLIDHTGVKAEAIADDLIVSDMIAGDSIGEKQINYSSFSSGFNKDTNTTTLLATKIKLNNQNQSLEVGFNSLKTQADGTKSLTESHSTQLQVQQGQIATAINNTQIVKDGQTILLKDDYNRTVATVDSMKSTIGQHTTQINEATGKITGVETKVNTVERDLNSAKSTITSHTTQINGLNSTTSTHTNEISQMKGQISLKVEQADINKAKSELEGSIDTKVNNAKSEIKLTTDLITSRVENVEVISLTNYNNLLINSNLSNSKDGWRMANPTKVTTYKSTSSKIEDKTCIRLDCRESTITIDSQKIPCITGEKITLSLFGLRQEHNKSLRAYLMFTANEEDITVDNTYFQEYTTIDFNDIPTNGTWTKKSNVYTVPADATRCFVRVRAESNYSDISFDGRGYVSSIMATRGDKIATWTANAEDSYYSLDSRVKSAELKITDDSIVSTVTSSSSWTTQTNKINTAQNTANAANSNLTTLTSRVDSAEQKITPSAIVSTVTSSTTYKDDLTGKVSTDQIMSSINQSAEKIKIQASKIQLEGLITNGVDGKRVEIQNEDYRALQDNVQKLSFGFKTFGDYANDIPALYLGANGMDYSQTSTNYNSNRYYLKMLSWGANNPVGDNVAYGELTYNTKYNDNNNKALISNIRLKGDGDIQVAPVRRLDIRTNYKQGVLDNTTNEKLLARFTTSSLSLFNSHLQIGAISNHSNYQGLVLSDRYLAYAWEESDGSQLGDSYRTSVAIKTLSDGTKTFRPATTTGDIMNGTKSYPWKSVTATNFYGNSGVVASKQDENKNNVVTNDIIDNIEFVSKLSKNNQNELIIDVSNIIDTQFVDMSEEGNAFINNHELLKLAIFEIKKLKEEIKILKAR